MSAILARLKTEPAVVIAFVTAVLSLAVTLGLPLTHEQSAGVVAFVTLVLGFWTRSLVTPVAAAAAKHSA